MPTTLKIGDQDTQKTKRVESVKASKGYGNDPYFVKKIEEATALLMKVGLPNFKKK